MNIAMGMTLVRNHGKRIGARVFVHMVQRDALCGGFDRCDIEYLPSGRKRHMRISDAQRLLRDFVPISNDGDGMAVTP